MSELFLSIDQGGQSTRVIAINSAGRAVASAAVPVATSSPGPGRFEQDPDALVDSVLAALREVVSGLPSGCRLRAGLATQRSSIACWDRSTGRALAPVLSWRDTRNGPWLASLGLDDNQVRRITGLRSSAHYGASKLRWCLDHYPAIASALAEERLGWGPLASFLVFRLTREKTLAADPANASRTLLMDLGTQDWSESMAAMFGLSTAALPPIVAEDEDFGILDIEGLSAPLVRCTGDQPAALFAEGSPGRSVTFVNAGTGAFALQQADWPNAEKRLLTSVIRGDDGLSFALEGTVNGAGAALAAESAALGTGDWSGAVPAVGTAADLPVFLNGHSGLGSPWWRESFRSRFVGNGTPETRMAAVLESIVFMLVENLRIMRERLGRQTLVRLSGGLSRGDEFCQALADLAGVPAERPATVEATARGLAWLAVGGQEDWARSGMTVFNPRSNPALRARFERWEACMDAALAADDV
jgi:glycerol kinase